MIEITTETLVKVGSLGNPEAFLLHPNGDRSQPFRTRRSGLFLLHLGLIDGEIDADTAGSLRADLETAELPEGAFFEMCSSYGKHAHLRLFDQSEALVWDKKEAHAALDQLRAGGRISDELIGLMEADIAGLDLPEELTEEQLAEQQSQSIPSIISQLMEIFSDHGAVQIVSMRRVGPPTEQAAAEAYAGPGSEDLDDINKGTSDTSG